MPLGDASWTPLHVAAYLGFGRLVKFLLVRGADPNVMTSTDRLALHLCLLGFEHGPNLDKL